MKYILLLLMTTIYGCSCDVMTDGYGDTYIFHQVKYDGRYITDDGSCHVKYKLPGFFDLPVDINYGKNLYMYNGYDGLEIGQKVVVWADIIKKSVKDDTKE